MKKRLWLCLALAIMTLMSCTAGGETTEVLLPDGIHRLTLPEGLVFQQPDGTEENLKGIWLREPDLEMLVFCYGAEGVNARSLAQQLVEAGRAAEVREIGGVEFLMFQDTDEADGAGCLGYAYLTEGQMIEISFFYGTQDAMNLTKIIMESFHI